MKAISKSSLHVLVLYLILCANAYAVNYVGYQTTIGNQTTIGSVPIPTSGFSYSDSQGNSIGYREIRSFPVIITNQYPNARWVNMQNGNVPFNAITSFYLNGRPIFYCRLVEDNILYYGRLIQNEGCYIADPPSAPRDDYQVLIK